MSTFSRPALPSSAALVLFEPAPNVVYSLDAAARLAGVSRRSVLIYCRAGLVRPVLQPPYDVLGFTEESIHAIRRIENLRESRRGDLPLLKALLELLDEVEHLRAELGFLRGR